MEILVIGQCTLHWGRMEYGNIGNYYIIEPFMRELHRVFPGCKIKTTMQMSERFCNQENIKVLPLNIYYGWEKEDLDRAEEELLIAQHFNETGELTKTTPFIEEVNSSDLIIDFSGDIWGDNANFLGPNRLKVGLIKDRIAQLLGKKVVMLAGSPGPFSNEETRQLAKTVFENFHLVTNREPVSIGLLDKDGFNVSRTWSLACPAFLFEPASDNAIKEIIKQEGLSKEARKIPLVGFVLCGWNFEEGPFDKHPRRDDEFIKFAQAVEFIAENLGCKVCLLSHSNGFDIPPQTFKLKHGRDYETIKQLEKVLLSRNITQQFFTLDGIYDAWQTKAILGQFDMLVSGRIHAAVSGLSQNVPTVIIDYGHEPKAHKLNGFAEVAQVTECIADPSSIQDMKDKIHNCWIKRDLYQNHLNKHIPTVKELARKNFDLLKTL